MVEHWTRRHTVHTVHTGHTGHTGHTHRQQKENTHCATRPTVPESGSSSLSADAPPPGSGPRWGGCPIEEDWGRGGGAVGGSREAWGTHSTHSTHSTHTAHTVLSAFVSELLHHESRVLRRLHTGEGAHVLWSRSLCHRPGRSAPPSLRRHEAPPARLGSRPTAATPSRNHCVGRESFECELLS